MVRNTHLGLGTEEGFDEDRAMLRLRPQLVVPQPPRHSYDMHTHYKIFFEKLLAV